MQLLQVKVENIEAAIQKRQWRLGTKWMLRVKLLRDESPLRKFSLRVILSPSEIVLANRLVVWHIKNYITITTFSFTSLEIENVDYKFFWKVCPLKIAVPDQTDYLKASLVICLILHLADHTPSFLNLKYSKFKNTQTNRNLNLKKIYI